MCRIFPSSGRFLNSTPSSVNLSHAFCTSSTELRAVEYHISIPGRDKTGEDDLHGDMPESLLSLFVTVGVPLKVVGGILGTPVVAELEDSRLGSDEFLFLFG